MALREHCKACGKDREGAPARCETTGAEHTWTTTSDVSGMSGPGVDPKKTT